MTTWAAAGSRSVINPTDNLTIDANYTSQTESSGGSSRYTPAGVAAFSGGPILPTQGCDLCNTDVTQSPWTDNLKVFGLTVAYKTGAGTVTGTTNQFNRTTGFTFDSTPILVSFDVPVAGRNARAANSKSQFQRAALCQRFEFSRQLRGRRLS